MSFLTAATNEAVVTLFLRQAEESPDVSVCVCQCVCMYVSQGLSAGLLQLTIPLKNEHFFTDYCLTSLFCSADYHCN